MTEREIVLSGLEEFRKELSEDGLTHVRMYEIIVDAMEYIKAQEPVAPVRKSFLVSADEYKTTPPMTVCGACGSWLLTVEPRAKYCPECGRAVKWE